MATLGIFVMGVTVITGARVYAVVTPTELSDGKRGNGLSLSSGRDAALQRSSLELQKISLEMEAEQARHAASLQHFRKALENVRADLNTEKNHGAEGMESKKWIPARIAWALDKNTK